MDAPAEVPSASPAVLAEPSHNPLRLRSAFFILVLLWIGVLVPPRVFAFGLEMIICLLVGVIGMQLLWLGWWLVGSRVPWRDRLAGLLLLILTLGINLALLYHPSAKVGLPGPTILGPWTLTVVTLVMWLTKPWAWRAARWPVAAALVVCLLAWNLIRVTGADGGLAIYLAWRWAPTNEQLFLAEQSAAENAPAIAPAQAEPIQLLPGDWPGFRGLQRDSRLVGETFATNWQTGPPQERWRVRVGPGWSSMAIVAGRLFTQEQRGQQECVVAYQADTGQQLWESKVEERFFAVESGPGPLATPTFHDGALYTTGATGVVLRIDPATGQQIWRRSLLDDLPRDTNHDWGFASSPLVVSTPAGDLVLVYGGNPPDQINGDQAVIAYQATTGEPVWIAGQGGHSYTSPMLVTLQATQQVLMASNAGLESLDPATGRTLWFYEWSTGEFPRIALPIIMPDETIVFAAGYGVGAQGLKVTKQGDDWQVESAWQTRQLKPYFNDNVGYNGHVYGFDNKFFTSISASTGELAWPKRSRRQTQFGCGQVLLVTENQTLLVLTELTGEIVLLAAKPGKPQEIARLRVFEEGSKTWNHPVIAHGRLYVRNGAEMVCYDLPQHAIAAR